MIALEDTDCLYLLIHQCMLRYVCVSVSSVYIFLAWRYDHGIVIFVYNYFIVIMLEDADCIVIILEDIDYLYFIYL